MAKLTADMAGLGCRDRIDRHARRLRLVTDEPAQLVERPALLPVAVVLPDHRVLPDAGQVLQEDLVVASSGQAAAGIVDGARAPLGAVEPAGSWSRSLARSHAK